MGVIERQNMEKNAKIKRQQEKNLQSDTAEGADAVEEADNLITFREFINAIKALVELRILPRTLSFREVLGTVKYETAFTVSDMHVDDFAMFRYELNSIFNLHKFEEERPSNLFMGAHPLSKTRDGK